MRRAEATIPTVLNILGGTLVVAPVIPEGEVLVTVKYDGFSITAAGGDGMAYTLPNDKQVHVQVAYVDAKGNPAQVDGDVEWSSSDENLLKVEADAEDTTKAVVVPNGPVGQGQVVATADADLGTGTKEIKTLMDITVAAGEAVAGIITPSGSPEPIP